MEKITLKWQGIRRADIDSDHHLVIGEVKMRIARVKQNRDLPAKNLTTRNFYMQKQGCVFNRT
jgi:hypothetical protein